MTAANAAVAAAFLYVLPLLLGFLAVAAWRRDRVSAWVLLAAALGFGLVLGLDRLGAPQADSAAPLPPGVFPLWPAAALALAIRLTSDRRQGHVRSTAESLAVLASGAILLAALLSLPAVLAPL